MRIIIYRLSTDFPRIQSKLTNASPTITITSSLICHFVCSSRNYCAVLNMRIFKHRSIIIALLLLYLSRTCGGGPILSVTAGGRTITTTTTTATPVNGQNHDSNSGELEQPVTRSSLATTTTAAPMGRPAATSNEGHGMLRTIKAIFEPKLRCPGAGSSVRNCSTSASGNCEIGRVNGDAASDSGGHTVKAAEGHSEEGAATTPSPADGPEVFLGGSCNPTTWRADVAIPQLAKSGISFYNPQVSDWTPDLIELEHRAKEKARILFFVLDSETRATAGAIEAAHIAGLNSKQLVMVMLPYKLDQLILNESISKQ